MLRANLRTFHALKIPFDQRTGSTVVSIRALCLSSCVCRRKLMRLDIARHGRRSCTVLGLSRPYITTDITTAFISILTANAGASYSTCRSFSSRGSNADMASSNSSGSSEYTRKLPQLRTLIRKLYLKVHPDLFEDYPRERDVNNKSIALMNSFLDSLKTGQFDAKGYELSFYLRPTDETAVESSVGVGAASPAPTELRLISFQLRAPATGIASLSARALLELDLKRLLQLCNVPSDFVWGDLLKDLPQEGLMPNFSRYEAGEGSLSVFLAESHEAARLRRGELMDKQRSTYLLTTTFRLKGLRVMFQDEMSLTYEEQWTGVQKLQALLDLSKGVESLDFSKFVVMLSDFIPRSKVDDNGRVVFALSESPQLWYDFVVAMNCEAVRVATFRERALRITKEKEVSVAKLLGIFHIFCEPFLYSQPEYLQFLDKLEAELHLFDALFQKRPELRELHIRVQRKDGPNQYTVDASMGFLMIPVSASPDRIRLLMDSKGAKALHISKTFMHSQREADAIALTVKRRLRLASLEFDAGISISQSISCLNRLLTCHPRVSSLLEGLAVRISHKYLTDARGVIHIKWDWIDSLL